MNKLNRITGYGAFALVAVWSLVAIVIHAVLQGIDERATTSAATDGWMVWLGQIGQAAGPITAVTWVAGTLIILWMSSMISRPSA